MAHKSAGQEFINNRSNIKLLSTWSTCLSNYGAQYNFQSIAAALLIMSTSVCTTSEKDCMAGHQEAWVVGTSNAVIFIGAVFGQLTMGFLGDYISRNAALALTLLVSTISIILSAVAPAGSPSAVYGTIILFRFFVGIGLGGIYPLSATKASEDTATSSEKANSSGPAFIFFWQIPGLVSPWLVAWLMTYSQRSANSKWRLLMGLGALPLGLAIGCLLLEAHLKKESLGLKWKAVSLASQEDLTVTEGGRAKASPKLRGIRTAHEDIYRHLQEGDNWHKLMASGGTWFLYDVIFYGLSLLGGTVLRAISATGDNNDVSANNSMRDLCSKQTLALSLGLIPMVANLYFLPRMDLVRLQVTGFLVQAFMLLMFVGCFDTLKVSDPQGLFAMYCMTQMALQFGVPVTTYALPSVLFDKEFRCTLHGIASAMGKLGAIFGAYAFYSIALASVNAVLIICMFVGFLGAYVSMYYLPHRMLEHDEMVNASTGSGSTNSSDAHQAPHDDKEEEDTDQPEQSEYKHHHPHRHHRHTHHVLPSSSSPSSSSSFAPTGLPAPRPSSAHAGHTAAGATTHNPLLESL